MGNLKTPFKKTNFEQVPIQLARKIAVGELSASNAALVLCTLCDDPVQLENCKIDENGKAVHQDCYVAEMRIARHRR
jgi:hypothetical protein